MTETVLKAMAAARARGSAALEREWLAAISRMDSTGVSEGSLRRLLDASASPVAFSRLAKRIAGDADENCAKLFDACKKSDCCLGEWLASVDAYYGWLEKRARTAPFASAVGYVACAAEVSKCGNLPATVEKMLDEYGVE